MMNEKQAPKFTLLETLSGFKTPNIPFWFMRQAGRYLPEYRDLRKTAGGFLDLVYNPERASEVTLQPIRRFGMSGAILFSDILVIPQALGQPLRFETGEGPKLDALETESDFVKLDISNIDEILSPIYDTVKLTRSKLSDENHEDTALIGFAGSPWTVACYMIEGGGSKTFQKTKSWAYSNPQSFQKLINILVEATSHYLIKQADAGAQALQLFDSWSGILDETQFQNWAINPTKAIIEKVKAAHPDIPFIGFPREAGDKMITYANQTKIQCLALDYSVSPQWVVDNVPQDMTIQGNLDPHVLLAGGDVLFNTAHKILEAFKDRAFIFNLGHGVIKETPPDHVAQLSKIIKDFKR